MVKGKGKSIETANKVSEEPNIDTVNEEVKAIEEEAAAVEEKIVASQEPEVEKEEAKEPEVPAKSYIVSDALNVRQGPGLEFPIITILNEGTSVTIKEVVNSYGKIDEGLWVAMKYLR